MSQKVLVIGAARSGLAGAEFLAKTGNQVVLTDMKQCNDIAELEKLCFNDPWSYNSIASELDNKLSLWLVAEENGIVL